MVTNFIFNNIKIIYKEMMSIKQTFESRLTESLQSLTDSFVSGNLSKSWKNITFSKLSYIIYYILYNILYNILYYIPILYRLY